MGKRMRDIDDMETDNTRRTKGSGFRYPELLREGLPGEPLLMAYTPLGVHRSDDNELIGNFFLVVNFEIANTVLWALSNMFGESS